MNQHADRTWPRWAACLALGALAGLQPAAAFDIERDPAARLGDFTLAAGQTLRLNAHLVPTNATVRDTAPVQCRVTLGFEYGGMRVGRELIALLRPNQNARLDITGSDHVGSNQSIPVQPCIKVVPAVQSSLPAVQRCALAVTLEVLDERGRVTAMVADPRLITPESAAP